MQFLVIARSEATKQSSFHSAALDCFASLAMTNLVASIKKPRVNAGAFPWPINERYFSVLNQSSTSLWIWSLAKP
jgi:hypothetical protein